MRNEVLPLRHGPESRLVPSQPRKIEQNLLRRRWILCNDHMFEEDSWDLFLFNSTDRNMFRTVFPDLEPVVCLSMLATRAIVSQEHHTLSTITSEQTSSCPANSANVSGCLGGPSLLLLFRPMMLTPACAKGESNDKMLNAFQGLAM